MGHLDRILGWIPLAVFFVLAAGRQPRGLPAVPGQV